MKLDPLTTVCFTGHRPNKLGGYDRGNPTIRFVRQELNKLIQYAVDQGYRTFISGMALGVDQEAAELVLSFKGVHPELGISLVAAVPFEGQEAAWPAASRVFYRKLLDQADVVHYVSPPGYEARKMDLRNRWVVEHSSLVIAVWNGTSGGTANCVYYAQARGKDIWGVNPNRAGEKAV